MGRSNLRAFSLLAFNWLVIVGLAVLCEWVDHIALYIPALWVIGGRMVALAEVMGHDSVHFNLFKQKPLNRWLDFLFFVPLFESWESYREEHDRHHKHLLEPPDPAYQDYERWGLLDKGKKNYFWIWFVRPILFFDTPYQIWSIARSLFTDGRYCLKQVIFWVPVVGLFVYIERMDLLWFYWFLPFLWVYPALIFWSEVGEHYKIPADRSRTRNTFGILEYFFISPHDDRYHAVHHIWPRIPWFNMRAATRTLMADANYGESHGFWDLYNQVRADVDPLTGKPVQA